MIKQGYLAFKLEGFTVLYIFSGLPGVGKSTLAQALAKATGACYLRIDTIEQGLRDLCDVKVEGEGDRLAYRIAKDNLKQGISVIGDSTNPIELTRGEWRQVAIESGVSFIDIEIVCSDKVEHQHRVETRDVGIAGLELPDWQQIQLREYHPWHGEWLRIDTAGRSVEQCLAEILAFD